MAVSGFLGQALTDPATGLPNLPYFSLIQDWETRRGGRRSYSIRVLNLRVQGPADRTLAWRLCQELRTSDLIASEGRHRFRILLTSPDAENVAAIGDRIRAMIEALNGKRDSEPMAAELTVEGGAEVEGNQGPGGRCGPPTTGESDAR